MNWSGGLIPLFWLFWGASQASIPKSGFNDRNTWVKTHFFVHDTVLLNKASEGTC